MLKSRPYLGHCRDQPIPQDALRIRLRVQRLPYGILRSSLFTRDHESPKIYQIGIHFMLPLGRAIGIHSPTSANEQHWNSLAAPTTARNIVARSSSPNPKLWLT